MRTLAALSLAFTTLFGATVAHAITARQAKPVIVAAVMKSRKVADKTGPFHTSLTGKGNLREFSASNVRSITMPGISLPGRPTGMRMSVGGIARGTINLKTNKVAVKGYSMVR